MTRESKCEWPFLSLLSRDEKLLLERRSILRDYTPGMLLQSNDAECIGLLMVRRGLLRVCTSNMDSRTVTLFFLGDLEVCILSASCAMPEITCEAMVEVCENSSMTLLPADTFNYLINHNLQFGLWAYRLAAKRLSTALKSMQQVMFCGIEKRVILCLLDEAARKNSSLVHITQEELARNASSSREVITRTLNTMAKKGLVTLTRGTIKITSMEKLKEAGA